MARILFIVVVFYVLTMIQMSLYVHILPAGPALNSILIAVVLIAIFESSRASTGFVAAITGGFLLDMFSGGFIGIWTLSLLAISLIIKVVLEKYVRPPDAQQDLKISR